MELLGELDEAAAGSPRAFFDRICRGICELTEMNRCALLLYDEREKRVRAAGSHGIDEAIVEQLHGTIDETPIAARALADDRVVVSSDLAGSIHSRHRRLPAVKTLACVPIAAGDRWLGVMFCDKGGGAFELEAPHRDLMWALGKTAALAASTRLAFAQHERAKVLAERVALAREVHDRVIQRLFGLSLGLGSGRRLSVAEQDRAAEELRSALEDLRTVIQGSGQHLPAPSETLAAEIARLATHYPDVELALGPLLDPPPALEPLAQSVLAEALHNARVHARAPRIEIEAGIDDGAFVLEVRNERSDAAPQRRRRPGMGLQLAALDALQTGAILEFGPIDDGRWRVRLVAPVGSGGDG